MDSTRRNGNRSGHATHRAAPAAEPRRVEEIEQLAELQRILDARPQQFRLQFFGVAGVLNPTIVGEGEIWAAVVSDVVREAASITWPAGAIGLRVLDQEGREVFERLKADC